MLVVVVYLFGGCFVGNWCCWSVHVHGLLLHVVVHWSCFGVVLLFGWCNF